MGTHQSPPFQRRMLGKKFRELREEAGLKAAEVARRTEISTGRLSRIENGEVAPDIPLAKFLLDLYLIPVNDWEPYLDQVRSVRNVKGWWQAYGVAARGYTALETAATSLCTFEIAYMPGLLRTEAHSRAGLRQHHTNEQIIENRLRVRAIRQERLHSVEDRLEVTCVIDESVLTRPIGTARIIRDQLLHLVEVATLPNVTLQVVPLGQGSYDGLDGAFTVLSFASAPDVAYIENVAGGFQIDKEDQVHVCRVAFDRIRSVALDPDETVALIRRVERSL